MEHAYNEGVYMSYNDDLGAYHTKRTKRYIEALPELYGNYKSLSPSESILNYQSPEGRVFFCYPMGIIGAQRGIHPNFLLCDDILCDPQKKLDLTQLEKIATKFFEVVEQRPKEELHVIGTPQDNEDLLAKLEALPEYHCRRYDAIVNEERKETLWPNNPDFSWEGLEARRKRIGDKAFMKEFRCMPVRGAESYIAYQKLLKLINPNLVNYGFTHNLDIDSKTVVAGMDLGKKTHPSHLSVFMETEGKLRQIHHKFMDGWDYRDQIEYARQAIKAFKIDKLYYDNTRAEFDLSAEQGDLPAEMEGVAFTAKTKFALATELDKAVTNEIVELLPDERQKRQILSVDCDLQAPETNEGHGDAFFSLCLAIKAWADASGILVTCI